ncbi:MAG: hypothetical protein QOH96_1472 [Blastocatellia bacterium]|nr:hypothetical protein [Blastocatellia bacterium]
MKTKFFKSPADFRKWLQDNHASADELWVGFYKKGSGRQSITWPESVDEALCFGWIDGIRKSVDEESYTIRFTPRRVGSIWSTVNINRAQALIIEGRMHQIGLDAFLAKKENKSGIYSYEQRKDQLDKPFEKILRQNRSAWDFFQTQSPAYRRAAVWWVVSAKREETRLKRLLKLIEDSAQNRTIPQFTPTKKTK